MKKKESQINNKKVWHKPAYVELSFQDTLGGVTTGPGENDTYYNPGAS
jgi:hypothetical protein